MNTTEIREALNKFTQCLDAGAVIDVAAVRINGTMFHARNGAITGPEGRVLLMKAVLDQAYAEGLEEGAS